MQSLLLSPCLLQHTNDMTDILIVWPCTRVRNPGYLHTQLTIPQTDKCSKSSCNRNNRRPAPVPYQSCAAIPPARIAHTRHSEAPSIASPVTEGLWCDRLPLPLPRVAAHRHIDPDLEPPESLIFGNQESADDVVKILSPLSRLHACK